MRQKLLKFLRKLLGKLEAKDNNQEYLDRIQAIKRLFHEILPTQHEFWCNKAIIANNPEINYFVLPSGNLPTYTIILPEIPLYVAVFDIRSADWNQARDRGVSRKEWEEYQLDMDALIIGTQNLDMIGFAVQPRILSIKWNDSINPVLLSDKLEECIVCNTI